MKTAHDFDQELLALFDAYVHGALDRRGFLDRAAKYAVGGVTAAMLLDQLSPKFARGAGRQAGGRAHQGAVHRVRVAEGLRQDARLPGAAGQGGRQAAGRARHSREPRAQPAHRGHRPPPGARQLRGVRAGRAVPARRLSRRAKTRPASSFPSSIRRKRAKTSSRRSTGSRRAQRPTARSARSASATAAAWSTSWRRGCPISRPASRSTAAHRTWRTCRRSKPR